jgi:geranylgeranyl pyrophosphate synthase
MSEALDAFVSKTRSELVPMLEASEHYPFMADMKAFADISEYYNRSHGKLLRPLLCVAFCDSLGGQHEAALNLGCALEQIHGASLTHDDLIDSDLFRRGLQSVHEKFHVIPAILFGDILMVNGLKKVDTLPVEHKIQAWTELVTAGDRLITGAFKEHKRDPWNKESYFTILSFKTATAYRAAARLGAITAHASDETKEIAGRVGEYIGIAFQLADDITDIEQSISKQLPIGDMKEGKVTLPIIHIRNKYPELAEQCELYSKGVEEMSDVSGVLDKMSEGISATHDEIVHTLNMANQLLSFIPLQNGKRAILEEYGRFAVDSILKESAS